VSAAPSPLWAVIRREFLQRVRSRWFVFATIGVPLLVTGATVIPMTIAARGEATARSVVVIDRSGELGDPVAEALAASGYTVERAAAADEPAARARVAADQVGSVLVLDSATLTEGRARLIASEDPSALRQLGIRQIVIQAALERQLTDSGMNVERVMGGGTLDLETIGESGGGMSDPAFAAAYMGSFVLYMVILIYAVAVMRSVLEEKTSRIVEIIISSVRPWQLMLGKILGVGAVGLTQLAVWALIVGGALKLGLPGVLAARPGLGQLAQLRTMLPTASFYGYFAVFFIGGYFIYSALYAAVGAMCNSEDEAQQAQFPIMLLILTPVLSLVSVIENPNSTASVVLSLIPLFSPFLMFARAAAGAAPAWQIALSVVLMALTVVAVAWIAGRIYRVGILMTGKRPTPRELFRWIREA
jgi:ABC-2 type transport system permease protein